MKIKPKRVLEILEEKGLPVPKKQQLSSYLISLRKKYYGASTISLGELEAWCKRNSLIIIIIITSHRLITRWGRLRLLLGSTCSQFLSSFSFYRQRYLHPFPSNILTNDVFSMVRMSHSRQLSR